MEFGVGEKYCSLFPILLCRTIVPDLLLEMVGRMMQKYIITTLFSVLVFCFLFSNLQTAYALTLFFFNIFAISLGEVRVDIGCHFGVR